MHDNPTPNPLSFTVNCDFDEEMVVVREKLDSMADKYIETYIRLKDEAVRGRLIQMGWTPPK
jgi:hypothetical protein